MPEQKPIGGDASPQEAAITGTVSPAAEPAPQIRNRESSVAASIWVYALVGAILIVTALVADQSSGQALGSAIGGGVLIFVAAFSMAGVTQPTERGIIGIVIGGLLTVLAFVGDGSGVAIAVFLASAAAVFITGFATLAASRRLRGGAEGAEPEVGVDGA